MADKPNPFAGGKSVEKNAGSGGLEVSSSRFDLCPFLGRVVVPVEVGSIIQSEGPQVKLEVAAGPCLRSQCVFWAFTPGSKEAVKTTDPEDGCRIIAALLDLEEIKKAVEPAAAVRSGESSTPESSGDEAGEEGEDGGEG